MGKIITLLIFGVIATANLYPQNGWQYYSQLEVGKRPAVVYSLGSVNSGHSRFIVVCAGLDANRNNIQEEGDEAPSIWFFEVESGFVVSGISEIFNLTEPKKMLDLDFHYQPLPMRIGFNSDDYKLYIPEPDGVSEISIIFTQNQFPSVYEISKKNLLPLKASGISSKDNYLYLSKRDEEDQKGEVLVYDVISKTFTDTIPAYPTVQMTATIDNRTVWVLNEKDGLQNSKIIEANKISGKYMIESDFEIAGGANHIVTDYGMQDIYTIMTCYESGDLKIIKGESNSDIVDFGIEGKIGPRESVFENEFSNDIYTSSYDGFVYVYNPIQHQLKEKIKAYGKAEGMAFSKDCFVITTPYSEGTTELPASTITLYGKKAVSVNDNLTESSIEFFPNPASDYIIIQPSEGYKVQIFDMLGLEVISTPSAAADTPQEGNLRIDISGLQSGVYLIKIGNRVEKFVKM